MAKILIVDDAAFMRMMLKDILTKGGFEIAGEAADGVEAVAKYNELTSRCQTKTVFRHSRRSKQLIQTLHALCVLQWDSSPWLLRQSSPVQRISLLSHFRQTVY